MNQSNGNSKIGLSSESKMLGAVLKQEATNLGAFIGGGALLGKYRNSKHKWDDVYNLIRGPNLHAGLVSKEVFDDLANSNEINKVQGAIHYGYVLEELDKEDEESKKKQVAKLNDKKTEIDEGFNEIEQKNFNMHFYRIMTSFLLFGVIDALDILSTAFDLMGGDFSDSIKEIFGSEKISGDLAEFYKAIKLDEVAGGLASMPIFEDLNQFFVDTMSSEYLSPVSSIGSNFLSSEMASFILGGVLIANRGYHEYNLHEQAKNLSEKEKEDIKEVQKNIIEIIKSAQANSKIYEKKKFVAMEDIKTELYWQKIENDDDFANVFFEKIKTNLGNEFLEHDSDEYKNLSDDKKKSHNERKGKFDNLIAILQDDKIDNIDKVKELKSFLIEPQNRSYLIKVDKMMSGDFFNHKDLIEKFLTKRVEYYKKKLSLEYNFSELGKLSSSVDDIIVKNKKHIAERTVNEETKAQLESENIFLNKLKENNFMGSFIEQVVVSEDKNIAIFDKVLKHMENGKIISDIRTKTPPSTLTNPHATSLSPATPQILGASH